MRRIGGDFGATSRCVRSAWNVGKLTVRPRSWCVELASKVQINYRKLGTMVMLTDPFGEPFQVVIFSENFSFAERTVSAVRGQSRSLTEQEV